MNHYATTTMTTTTLLDNEDDDEINQEILYTKEYFHEMQDDIDLIKYW